MGIPLPALGIRPPAPLENPLEQYGRMLQLSSLTQEGQIRQMQMERERMALASQKILQSAAVESGGDVGKMLQLAAQKGADPQTLITLQSSLTESRKNLQLLDEVKFKNVQTSMDLVARALKSVKDAAPQMRPQVYAQQLAMLQQNEVDTSRLPAQYPGDEVLPLFDSTIGMSKSLMDEEIARRGMAARELTAQTGADRLTLEIPGIIATGKIATEEAALTPEERQMQKATEANLAALAGRGYAPAKAALGALTQFRARTAGAEAEARSRGEMAGFGGMGGIPQAAVPGMAGAPTFATNEEILSKLSPGLANIVKALVEGRLAFPGSFALRSPYWQKLLQLAGMYDPNFDATQFQIRTAVRTEFTKGKAAGNIRSLNTAIGHLKNFKDSSEALQNRSVQFWNRIANYTLSDWWGDPRVRRFLIDANAVAGEAATVFKGTAGTDQEITTWKEQLNSSDSPEKLQATYEEIVRLLGSRMDALDYQWVTGMKKARDFKLLSPKSIEILKGLGGAGSALLEKEEVVTPVPGVGAAPPPGAPPPTPAATSPTSAPGAPAGGAEGKVGKAPPPGAVSIGTSRKDGRDHYLDAQGKDLGAVE